MKKKHVLLIASLALVLSSCLFDSDDNGLGSWFSDQGLPGSYKVQTLSVEGLVPTSVKAYRDTLPLLASVSTVFGNSSKVSHEIVAEFGYIIKNEEFLKLKEADSAEAYISFPLIDDFYKDKNIKDKVFPLKETLNVKVSWRISRGNDKKFIDSVANIPDSVWVEGLLDWKPDAAVDTTYSINLKKADSTVYFDMPKSFIDSLATCESACHVEVRLSAPESQNLYRFYVSNGKKNAILRVGVVDGDTKKKITTIIPFPMTPYRVADVMVSNDCSDCLVLHGGGLDSLVVEFPADQVLNALSEFYGDDFPYNVGDGYDVRQAVVLAQLTFARNDADGENHLGLPIKVVAGSFIDSAGTELLVREDYKPNKNLIKKKGHPDMVFYSGDSLVLQVTEGVRSFVNRASNNAKLKMLVRLGLPVLQDKDPVYRDTIYVKKIVYKTVNSKVVSEVVDYNSHADETPDVDSVKVFKDTSYRFLNYYDYARYDFTNMMNQPVTLKLWLATKRGDE